MEEKYILNKPEHLEDDPDAKELPWELIEKGEVDSEYLNIINIDENPEEPITIDKEDDEEEKLRKAYETIKHKAPLVPGLGNVEPISPPEEEIKLDQDEIPWELKDAEDAQEDNE